MVKGFRAGKGAVSAVPLKYITALKCQRDQECRAPGTGSATAMWKLMSVWICLCLHLTAHPENSHNGDNIGDHVTPPLLKLLRHGTEVSPSPPHYSSNLPGATSGRFKEQANTACNTESERNTRACPSVRAPVVRPSHLCLTVQASVSHPHNGEDCGRGFPVLKA